MPLTVLIWLAVVVQVLLLAAMVAGLVKLTDYIMKLSQVKADVAAIRADSTEAIAELATRISELDKQIADLIAGASDPDITDEVFLDDLKKAKENSAALKEIVPGTPATTTP